MSKIKHISTGYIRKSGDSWYVRVTGAARAAGMNLGDEIKITTIGKKILLEPMPSIKTEKRLISKAPNKIK